MIAFIRNISNDKLLPSNIYKLNIRVTCIAQYFAQGGLNLSYFSRVTVKLVSTFTIPVCSGLIYKTYWLDVNDGVATMHSSTASGLTESACIAPERTISNLKAALLGCLHIRLSLRKFLIASAYACWLLAGCQAVHDSDVEFANSREKSIKRASETETLVALLVRAFFYNAALRLLNIESFLQFNSALLCQVKPSFRNTRVLKEEPSLVLSFQLDLPYASEIIVALLNYVQ